MDNNERTITSHRLLLLEQVILWAIWLVVFLMPVFGELRNLSKGDDFLWREVFMRWHVMVPYLVIFCIHNYILIPKLLFAKRRKWYVLSVVLITLFFTGYEYQMHQKRRADFMIEMARDPQLHPQLPDRHKPPHYMDRKRPLIPGPVFFPMVLLLLMFGFNLSIVLIIKHQRDQEYLKDLERLRLQDELRYLKTQINPHFFMNMLNNIHAMVEVEPSKAQFMILELSKLMRYVLYEGDTQRTTLNDEIKFISSYVALMKMRYSGNKVAINLAFPEAPSENTKIPPLLFIAFIENAFKHGISYVKHSEVNISLSEAGESLRFCCSNTKPAKPLMEKSKGGVGLDNVRRRLDLLYGDNYSLRIDDDEDRYNVVLIIPHV